VFHATGAHGFGYDYGTGITSTVWDYPGNQGGTNFLGINDNGLILGWANFGDHFLEFLYDENKFTSVDLPFTISSTGYNLWGLNDVSDIVGSSSSADCTDGAILKSNLVP
jgi:hypothetical protein